MLQIAERGTQVLPSLTKKVHLPEGGELGRRDALGRIILGDQHDGEVRRRADRREEEGGVFKRVLLQLFGEGNVFLKRKGV